MIVCVEGLDGVGKSTQAALLVERLKAKFFKFPSKSSATGKIIYEHLERKWEVTRTARYIDREFTDSMVFQALQLTNRMEFASEIKDAAGRGHVVMDRYWPSGFAYGCGDGLDPEYLLKIHEHLVQADLYFLLDADVEDSAKRMAGRVKDRNEDNTDLLRVIANHYRTLWTMMSAPGGPAVPRWVVINARGTKEQTTELINQAIIAFRGE